MLHRLMVILLCYAVAFNPLALIGVAFASQNSLTSPTTGTVSGVQVTNNYNNALDSVNTCNSGSSAPTNQLSGTPSLGNCWLNTTNNSLNFYDGSSTWVTVGYIDPTNHLFTSVLTGAPVSVASASTANLCGTSGASPNGISVTITGTTTITSFGSNCPVGTVKIVGFAGVLTLTQSSSLVLPTGANVTTAGNDVLIARYGGSGIWGVISYQRFSGSALSSSLNFTGALFVNGAITPSSLGTSQNNYSPSGLSTANVIRQASSAAVNITGLVAPAINGQRLTLQNVNAVGGFNITLTANDANSTLGYRFLFPHPIGLQPNQSLTVVYDVSSLGWRLEQKVYASPYQGGFKNLRVFNVATALGDSAPSTPNSQIKVAVDEIVLEDGSGNATKSTSVACTIDYTTSGAGGLDTGSLAAGNWYFDYVIFNPTTNTTSCLGSLQSAVGSVTLPSGYTFIARVGADYYLTHNSITGFQRVVQYGRRAQYVVAASTPTNALPQLITGTSGSVSTPTYTAIAMTTFAPPTASSIRGMLSLIANSGGTVIMAPNASYGAFNSSSNPPPAVLSQAATINITINQVWDFTLESANVYYASNTTGSFSNIEGWEDNL